MLNRKKRIFSILAIIILLISIGMMLYPKSMVDVKMITPNDTTYVYHSYVDQMVYWHLSIFPRYTVILSLIYIVSYIIYIIGRKNKIGIVLFVLSMLSGIVAACCAVMSTTVWTDNPIKFFIVVGLCISIVCIIIDRVIDRLD